jgi:hypothetical protein
MVVEMPVSRERARVVVCLTNLCYLGPHWAQYTPKNEVSFLISLSPFESWVTHNFLPAYRLFCS